MTQAENWTWLRRAGSGYEFLDGTDYGLHIAYAKQIQLSGILDQLLFFQEDVLGSLCASLLVNATMEGPLQSNQCTTNVERNPPAKARYSGGCVSVLRSQLQIPCLLDSGRTGNVIFNIHGN
jgi:hypothetical protein